MKVIRALTLVACWGLLAVTSLASEADPQQTCNACVTASTSFHSCINNAASNPRALTALKENICGAHPPTGQRQCWELLDRVVPALDQKLAVPAQVCSDTGLCSQKDALAVAAKQPLNGDIDCPLCEYLVITVKGDLEDPDTEAKVLERANQACDELPVDAQSACHEYVAQYAQQIFAWIHSADPQSICTMVGVCDASLRLRKLPEPVLSAVADLLTTNVGDDDQCQTCQMVILEAVQILSDPDTQKQILEYVKESCADFQSFQDQCEAYVELYGPMVLNMARQYLKPELCTQLGFCPTSDEIVFKA